MVPRIADKVIRAEGTVKDDWDQWSRELQALAGRSLTASEVLRVTVATAKRYPGVAVSILGGGRR